MRPHADMQAGRVDCLVFGLCRRSLTATLAAGMYSSPDIGKEIMPNGSFPCRRIHTSDPLQSATPIKERTFADFGSHCIRNAPTITPTLILSQAA